MISFFDAREQKQDKHLDSSIAEEDSENMTTATDREDSHADQGRGVQQQPQKQMLHVMEIHEIHNEIPTRKIAESTSE